ncbi:cobyric acid synthase [Carboxydothermus hydrogenoformans]|uniref:Cobyric acid synthase n=1 Tax=Carboxydothermus hydrogenoformans (strain ATCC BAA-161 / DSM 6008 / Z-2901) TaxID=246194 RepID=COBQ_CARHZ|nr:cobyric acid synthase [Carboxydothermus hydrogenoformans]Q3AE11.1 RecName: Full=Cobyric acid synthase [Carboxydothermus hydrogenoformans Z-2901]ABB14396.1 cobyric acid synthase CobQ [Carboxydothermus hydrogenoformans Z-2901]
MARAIMFQGTASHVGKSVLTLALARVLYLDGFKVAPFKAQNMALNSYVTLDGGEMGRAQVAQAEACGLEPRVEMNPVLLKPSSDKGSQVIVLGKPIGHYSAKSYHLERRSMVWEAVKKAYETLAQEFDFIVIEGAGSPAEVNLKASDIANMKTAFLANAPVILVADIDRGGALASLVGTMELLEPEERKMVCGFILNKFRGDLELLKPALTFLEEKTGIPVLGVMPYIPELLIPEEDSVSLEETVSNREKDLKIGVVWYPRISNFTDFEIFQYEPDVELIYIKTLQDFRDDFDLVILPGSKNTVADLNYLKQRGLDQKLYAYVEKGKPLIGICGGLQILGEKILDPDLVEGKETEVKALGILDTVTEFRGDKITRRTSTRVTRADGYFFLQREEISGYEIHHGRTFLSGERSDVLDNTENPLVFARGRVLGTYLHGLFDNDFFRHRLLNRLRREKGLDGIENRPTSLKNLRQENYDKIARVFRENVNLKKIYEILGI